MTEFRKDRIRKTIGELRGVAPVQADIYELVHLCGLAQAEVCRKLGKKSSNVSTQLRAAEDFVRRYVGDNPEGVR